MTDDTPTAEDRQRADLLQRATDDVLTALGRAGIGEDADAAVTVLGIVAGCFAKLTTDPEEAMELLNTTARGVIDGSLLADD